MTSIPACSDPCGRAGGIRRVVLTQPEPRGAVLARGLRARGHEVVELGLRSLERLPQAPPPEALLAGLPGRCDWVVFVSPGAIGCALRASHGRPPAWPPAVGLAVVGPGSAQALAELGLAPPAVRLVMPAAAPYDAQSLLRTPPFDAPAGLRILVVHGENGRTDWLDALRARGARVERLAVYRSVHRPASPQALAALRGWAAADAPAVFVFTGAGVAAEVDRLLAEAGLGDWARGQPALAVHPRIAGVLERLGWRDVRPLAPGERALAGGIESA